MSSNDTKHVQTELSEDEYERFCEFARERGLSLKEAGHKALIEWVERQQQANPNDRAFTVLDELAADSLPASAETDAREEGDLGCRLPDVGLFDDFVHTFEWRGVVFPVRFDLRVDVIPRLGHTGRYAP